MTRQSRDDSRYHSAVTQLYRLGHELERTSGRKFDLDLVRLLLAELANPQQRFPSVLIAGTNGKGSTATTLASILRAAGHRTGLYTSPHLQRINERIQINREPISNEDFADVYERVSAAAHDLVKRGALPWQPSFFEMLTAMAFLYFTTNQLPVASRQPSIAGGGSPEAAIDIAVLEVGMGGRLDATNIVDPLVSVITDISLDHQEFLGHTIREIAREKAGIIRPGRPVVTLPQHPQANDVIGHAILESGGQAVSAVPYMPLLSPGSYNEDLLSVHTHYPVEVRGQQIMVESPLTGRHQWRNIALAIAAAEELNRAGIAVSPRHIEQGIRQTSWPGRFQVLAADPRSGHPEIVLDVAHNPAGAWALRAALSERYAGGDQVQKADDKADANCQSPVPNPKSLVFLFGAMRDKAIGEMASILFPLADAVVATRADTPRAASAEEICEAASRIFSNIRHSDSVKEGLQSAFSMAGSHGVVVVTGSIYVVGEASNILACK